MKKIITLIFVAMPLGIFAQNLVRDRLNSKRVDMNIFLNFFGDSIKPEYSIDQNEFYSEKHFKFYEFNKHTTFAINGETARLQLKFLNPLKYKVNISTKETDDPLSHATDSLMNNIKQLAGLITPAGELNNIISSTSAAKEGAVEAVDNLKKGNKLLDNNTPNRDQAPFGNNDTSKPRRPLQANNSKKKETELEEDMRKIVAIVTNDPAKDENERVEDCLKMLKSGYYKVLNKSYLLSPVAKRAAVAAISAEKIKNIKSNMLFDWAMWI